MVEVSIDSIRVSLMSQHRIVILKDVDSDRFLPIWIGPYEAEAITVSLQQLEVSRPLTHDLLRNVLQELGAEITQINITKLKDDVFFAQIIMTANGQEMRSTRVPPMRWRSPFEPTFRFLFLKMSCRKPPPYRRMSWNQRTFGEGGEERLEVFKDFVETLDLDDMDSSGGNSEE